METGEKTREKRSVAELLHEDVCKMSDKLVNDRLFQFVGIRGKAYYSRETVVRIIALTLGQSFKDGYHEKELGDKLDWYYNFLNEYL